MTHSHSRFFFALLLVSAAGCSDAGDNGSSAAGAGGDASTTGRGSAGSDGNGAGAPGGSSTAPDSRDVPDVGEPGFDPSVDPGLHPAFIDDEDLTRSEDYVYVATQAGDHELADGIVAIDYDVTGQQDLKAVLTSHLSALQAGHGLRFTS